MNNMVRIFRAFYNLTEEDLAENLGVTRHSIIAIENERYDPSLGLALKMSDLFGMPIEDIFLHEKLK